MKPSFLKAPPKFIRKAILIGAFALVLIAVPVLAQTGYDLSWYSIDGGGAYSKSEEFMLTGSAGQPDAGLLTGGGYTLAGGLWGGGAVPVSEMSMYLPMIVR